MALIACSECKREVSTHARCCPHCGNPISELHVASRESQFPVVSARAGVSSMGRCYACGSAATRTCTHCGKLCCGHHITWFHTIKHAGAVCRSCQGYGGLMSVIGLLVAVTIAVVMFGSMINHR